MKNIKLRKIQLEARSHALDLVEIGASEPKRKTTFIVGVPGGGKQIAVSVFFAILLQQKGAARRLLWIVPRSSLRDQAVVEFNSFMDDGSYIAVATKAKPPFMPADPKCLGYVTTYQALGALVKAPGDDKPKPAWELHVEEMKKSGLPWLVVLDECHHLADVGAEPEEVSADLEDRSEIEGHAGGQWSDAVEDLKQNAWHTILMTGTPERHDNRKIPFVVYEKHDGRLLPKIDIEYQRMHALQEHAIIKIECRSHDGWVAFENLNAKMRRSDAANKVPDVKIISEEADEKTIRKIIRAFLRHEGYWKKLLKIAVDHWISHRTRTAYESRLLVICDTQKQAIAVKNELRRMQVAAMVATSSAYRTDPNKLDRRHGNDVVKDFRKGDGDALVTVAMAHEGFDAKNLSHVVYLSSIRSLSWVTQALDRGSRFDPEAAAEGIPWEEQWNYVFVPDDRLMQAIVDKIKVDELGGITAQPPEQRQSGGGGNGAGDQERKEPKAIDAGLTAERLDFIRHKDEIPVGLPTPATDPTARVSPEADARLLAEIDKLASAHDRAIKAMNPRAPRVLRDLPRKIGLPHDWRQTATGATLVRIRDFLKKMVGPVV